jgi:predicted dehydrogenase
MLDAAERRGIRNAVGLQGQMSPTINYVKDLVAEGYVGQVLTATMIGRAPNWGAKINRAYHADRANADQPPLTLTGAGCRAFHSARKKPARPSALASVAAAHAGRSGV